jgi:hypothetical protein
MMPPIRKNKSRGVKKSSSETDGLLRHSKKSNYGFELLMTILLLGGCLTILVLGTGTAPPVKDKTLYFIRHCEKDSDREMGLSSNGVIHSTCYIEYFRHFPLGPPQLAYSTNSRIMGAVDSIIPLSEELQLPLHISWKEDYDVHMIKSFMLNYDIIVISMEHQDIPILASQLGCRYCKSWNSDPSASETQDDLYDLTWAVDYKSGQLRVYAQNFELSVDGSSGRCRNISEFEYEFRTILLK